ncbi:MAG: branched-chain-amino-acid transaminase, partial [Ignavibacteriales bacterium]|nr:branched-chain-amino-acid transaminase [Ignavibacteriales bacterium]
CWFEGIRCYDTKKGSAIFRLDAHVRRLYDSAKIYHAEIPYTQAEFEQAIIDTIKVNKMPKCYIRPIVYRGYGDVGVNPLKCPVDVAVAVWDWGKYLGSAALDEGIEVCISSWQRNATNTTPALAKAAGNYLNSQLIKMEAVLSGYAEGIALDRNGMVSEGSGENLFVVRDGVIYTSPVASGILLGITRDTVLKFAQEEGIPIRETQIPREFLMISDELFFTGTAAEITPIRSIDHLTIGNGKMGPITKRMQEKFFDVVHSGNDTHGWLRFITAKNQNGDVKVGNKKLEAVV